jgi:hypothetical protein
MTPSQPQLAKRDNQFSADFRTAFGQCCPSQICAGNPHGSGSCSGILHTKRKLKAFLRIATMMSMLVPCLNLRGGSSSSSYYSLSKRFSTSDASCVSAELMETEELTGMDTDRVEHLPDKEGLNENADDSASSSMGNFSWSSDTEKLHKSQRNRKESPKGKRGCQVEGCQKQPFYGSVAGEPRCFFSSLL